VAPYAQQAERLPDWRSPVLVEGPEPALAVIRRIVHRPIQVHLSDIRRHFLWHRQHGAPDRFGEFNGLPSGID